VCDDTVHLDMSDPSAGIDALGRGKLRSALRANLDDTTVKLLDEAIASHLAEQ
jgi:hypothetical protein